MSEWVMAGCALLAVPFVVHFIIGVRWFGWRFALLTYGCGVCLVAGAILLGHGLSQ